MTKEQQMVYSQFMFSKYWRCKMKLLAVEFGNWDLSIYESVDVGRFAIAVGDNLEAYTKEISRDKLVELRDKLNKILEVNNETN